MRTWVEVLLHVALADLMVYLLISLNESRETLLFEVKCQSGKLSEQRSFGQNQCSGVIFPNKYLSQNVPVLLQWNFPSPSTLYGPVQQKYLKLF